MIKGIYMSSRSLNTRFKNLSVISNNIANLDTTGYKRKIPFSEVMAQQAEKSKMKQVTDFQQGSMIKTANELDLAIEGDSFFVLNTDEGVQFTRNGRFNVSDDGFLVNENGLKVLGKSGEINIRAAMLDEDQTLKITRKGEIKAGEIVIDTIMIADIEDKSQLKNIGESKFQLEEADFTPADEDSFEVIQGYLEGSNTNAVTEMEAMIEVSRDYESSHKIVNYLDRTLEQANSIGKV